MPGSLLITEVLYDPEGLDGGREWLELKNTSMLAIDLTALRIEVATSGAYRTALPLSGNLRPGGCAVVGGPAAGSTAGNSTSDGFAYLLAADFSPDLGNATNPSDGIRLVTSSGAVLDAVVYGVPNSDGIIDPDGAIASPAVADAASGQSIERLADGTWRVQEMPNPGDCSALESPPPAPVHGP